MANVWNVVQMDCYPEIDGEKDVVFVCHWTLTASEDGYSSSIYGSVNVSLDSESPFTPYDQLTEDQVIGWVKDALGQQQVNACEATVEKQLADQKNPPVVTPPLPW